MSAHAKLSPSSSARWLVCTASVKACESYDDTSGSAAEYGTACHGLGELMLKGEPFPKTGEFFEDLYEGKVRSRTEVDIEMINTAMQYAEYCREHTFDDSVVMIEERFDLSFIAPDTFGTGDYTVLNEDHLHVIDLKTGHNIVMAKDNTQLMLYAVGALHTLLDNFEIEDLTDVKTVTLHIMQSRAGHIDTWDTTVDDLLLFEAHVKAQANAILKGNVTYVPDEYACKWCDHKVNCKALAEHVDEVMQDAFDDISVDDAPQEHITRMLKNTKLITSYLKAVEDKALELAVNGENIEGFKLVRKTKNLAWTDAERAEKYLVRKLKQDGAYTRKLITPTQAIKALGKENAKYLQKLSARAEGELTLAPLSDKRQAVSAPSDAFDDLDEEL